MSFNTWSHSIRYINTSALSTLQSYPNLCSLSRHIPVAIVTRIVVAYQTLPSPPYIHKRYFSLSKPSTASSNPAGTEALNTSYASRVFPSQRASVERIIKREQSLLGRVQSALLPLDLTASDERALSSVQHQLRSQFCVTVVGEFNAGKSSLINAIAGRKLCKDGVTPTTSQVHVLQYGNEDNEFYSHKHTLKDNNYTASHEKKGSISLDWLQGSQLVDTPGTNAIMSGHQQITEELIPRSDLIIFVTSVERPFSESERLFMSNINEWKRKIVIVVNKIDALGDNPEDIEYKRNLDEVMNFVRENAAKLLNGSVPVVLSVSSRLALQAKIKSRKDSVEYESHSDWKKSSFGFFEDFVRTTLTHSDTVSLKLSNALAVVERIFDRYSIILCHRQREAQENLNVLAEASSMIKKFETDVKNDFFNQMCLIDNVMLRLMGRASNFLDENLRFNKLTLLFRTEHLRKRFQEDVIRSFSDEVERAVSKFAQWISYSNFSQSEKLSCFFIQRARRADELLSKNGARVSSERQSLVHDLLASARSISCSHFHSHNDCSESVGRVIRSIQTAAISSLMLQGSAAVGVGVLVSAASIDVSGILGATAVATIGTFVLPFRREQLKKQIQRQTRSLQAEVSVVCQQFLNEQLHISITAFNEKIKPYIAQCEAEESTLQKCAKVLRELKEEKASIAHDISSLKIESKKKLSPDQMSSE